MILDLMTVVTARTPLHRKGRQTKFPSHHIPAMANCGQVGSLSTMLNRARSSAVKSR